MIQLELIFFGNFKKYVGGDLEKKKVQQHTIRRRGFDGARCGRIPNVSATHDL